MSCPKDDLRRALREVQEANRAWDEAQAAAQAASNKLDRATKTLSSLLSKYPFSSAVVVDDQVIIRDPRDGIIIREAVAS